MGYTANDRFPILPFRLWSNGIVRWSNVVLGGLRLATLLLGGRG